MEKEFRGFYGKSWWSLLVPSNVAGLLSGHRLKISADKLVITYRGQVVEVPKSQIERVKDAYFWGAVEIVTSGMNLPGKLIFYPLLSTGPLRTSSVHKSLKSTGYMN